VTSLSTWFEASSSSTPPSLSLSRKVYSTLTHCLLIALALFFGAQSAFAQTETILYSFKGGTTDGAEPSSGLLMDSSGNLYGTAVLGGSHGYGTAYELSLSGSTWSETGLYSFKGGTTDGAYPYSGLVMDSSGNLYSTTYGGGLHNLGAFFEVTPGSTWSDSVLYNFGSGTQVSSWTKDGDYPYDLGQIVMAGGNFYGTTYEGGQDNYGVVFEASPPVAPATAWTESVIYDPSGVTNAPGKLKNGLFMDSSGNLYGGSLSGGAHGYGTVFEVSSGGTGSVLYSFAAGTTDGAYPIGGLMMDSSGNLYGVTAQGGAHNNGTVFKLSYSGTSWTETVLHSFGGSGDGYSPNSGLVMDSSGNLYGTTFYGGAHSAGTAYEITSSGTESVLHSFAGGASDGSYPIGAMIIDSSGNLYGTTEFGGSSNCAGNGCGAVFKLVP